MELNSSNNAKSPKVFLNQNTKSKTFSFENGGSEVMKKDSLQNVANNVFEHYILELKGNLLEIFNAVKINFKRDFLFLLNSTNFPYKM